MSRITHHVKMLKTIQAYDSLNGDRKLGLYNEGEQYEITDSLLKDLIEDGAVELLEGGRPPVESREKKVISVMETKPAKGSGKGKLRGAA